MDAIEMIQIVAKALQNLKEDVVFIGGAALPLYFRKEPLFEMRPTDDVDCVIELTTRSQYYKLEQKLRDRGYYHDSEWCPEYHRQNFTGSPFG
ncbi:MAG: hypothetical protein HY466_00605 [Deltaproteobacteria bacterium]|nr:hypothetical protein [Deltaproteobacteria bacterium]